MNNAINRAAQPGATASSVLFPTGDRSSIYSFPPTALSDPADAECYFSALLSQPPILNPRGAVGLLAGTATYFVSGDPSTDYCLSYLRAVAANVDGLVGAVSGASSAASRSYATEAKLVADVLHATGCAAVRCQVRSNISHTGVIPALAKIASVPFLEETETSIATVQSISSGGNSVLTPAHPVLMQCCLLSGHYRFATKFASLHPVYAVRPGICPISSDHYLRYFYYMGMIHIGSDDLRSAVHCFSICLTIPSQIVSAITIAARKKMLLCNCLLCEDEGDKTSTSIASNGDGKGTQLSYGAQRLLEIPISASPAVSRFLGAAVTATSSLSLSQDSVAPQTSMSLDPELDRHQGAMGASSSSVSSPRISEEGRNRDNERKYHGLGVYGDMVKAYHSGDIANFERIVTNASSLLVADGNFGLTNQLRVGINHRAVRKLSNIYEVISLEKIGSRLALEGGTPEAETLLLEMVAVKRRHADVFFTAEPFEAKIDHQNGMVYFGKEDEYQDNDLDESDWDSEQRQEALKQRMMQCMNLAEKIRSLDVTITTSTKYQSVVARAAAVKTAVGSGGGAPSAPRGVAEF